MSRYPRTSQLSVTSSFVNLKNKRNGERTISGEWLESVFESVYLSIAFLSFSKRRMKPRERERERERGGESRNPFKHLIRCNKVKSNGIGIYNNFDFIAAHVSPTGIN